MFIDHLIDGVFKHNNVLIEGIDTSLQFDAIDQKNRDLGVFFTQGV
jgi:hypothetical protein